MTNLWWAWAVSGVVWFFAAWLFFKAEAEQGMAWIALGLGLAFLAVGILDYANRGYGTP